MQDKSSKLKIQHVPIGSLRAATYNPRKFEEAALERLRESLQTYGFVDPLIVNGAPKRRNIVVGGHARLCVAKKLGFKSVPVVYVHLSVEREKRLNLILNRPTGTWDFELLKNFEIDTLLAIGFDDAELSHIWDDHLETEDDGWNEEAELKKIKRPTVKPGELYALGAHRLVCIDSRENNAIRKLVGKTRIDMINFDPPFNISLQYEGAKGQYGGTYQDNKTDTEYRIFLKTLLQSSLAVAKPNVHAFVWCDQNSIGLVQSLYDELDITRKRVCTWIKNNANPTPQVAFNKATENCVYGTRGRPYISPRILNLNEIANKEIGSGSRLIDDILDLFEIWLVKRLPSSQYEHPTQKPPTLYEKALRRCSKPGDAILDVTAGSGSLMVACDQLKRRAFLADADPIFASLILRRYEKLTGKKPKKLN